MMSSFRVEYPQLEIVLSPVPPEVSLEDQGGGGRDVVADILYGVLLALRGLARLKTMYILYINA